MTPEQRADIRSESRIALAMFLFLVVSFVGYCGLSYRTPRWRVAFFQGTQHEGAPLLVRWQAGLRSDWQRKRPFPTAPRDHFSVRFETCLLVPEARKVAFLLTSDDGSWLFVDGREVIQNGGVHPRATKGAEVDLAAGAHHLRVDYFEARGRAFISLIASLDGRAPRQIAPEHLIRPVDGRCPEG